MVTDYRLRASAKDSQRLSRSLKPVAGSRSFSRSPLQQRHSSAAHVVVHDTDPELGGLRAVEHVIKDAGDSEPIEHGPRELAQ